MRTRMPATDRNKFLPFDKFHVAPIGGIDPKSLKEAAKLARTRRYRDDERRLPHQLVLNHIAKSLGFHGGFSGYRKEYEERLTGFMEEQGLVSRRDVFALPAEAEAGARLTYRQIADRLFSSGLAAPKRMFAGIDIFELLKAAAATDDLKIGRGTYGEELAFAGVEPAEITSRVPPFNYAILGPEGTLWVQDLMWSFHNLVGDQLCDGRDNGRIVAQRYGIDGAEGKSLCAAGHLLRRVLDACPSGWVEVVPYNERLAFLKAPDGGYEFVFERLRDAEFGKNIYYPYLRDKDVSKSEDANDFELHLYFRYRGWLEADRHEAEKAFYEAGGSTAIYPGEDEVLKAHLIRNGGYRPPVKKEPRRPGYAFAERAGHRLCFSELITVERFRRFLERNPDYVEHRHSLPDVEALEAVNNESPDLPAAVTWHDAKAYARWIKRTNKLPVRLPTEDEFLALAADLSPNEITGEEVEEAFDKRLCAFFDPSGRKFDGHPPYMPCDEFARWELRYDRDHIEWGTSETGLRTLRSAYFGEWLLPRGAAINGLFMCSQNDVALAARTRVSAERGRFSPCSTGKYKSMKIGFRLVYDAKRGGRK